jgi:hypothetical protein
MTRQQTTEAIITVTQHPGNARYSALVQDGDASIYLGTFRSEGDAMRAFSHYIDTRKGKQMTTQQTTEQTQRIKKVNGYAVIHEVGNYLVTEASPMGGGWDSEVYAVVESGLWGNGTDTAGRIRGRTKEQAEARAIMFAAMLNVTR